MLDRAQRLLCGIDPHQMVGLEIGPLDKPLVKKDGASNIYYADYASRETLQKNSMGDGSVDINEIPDIDYVLTAPLPERLDRQFDYVIASHVAEHVPDFLGWITTIFGWLKPGGRVILAIPDKRYCFDILRNTSTAGQLMEAFFERRPYPKLGAIYDGMRQAVRFDTARAWSDPHYQGPFEPVFSPGAALYTAKRALEPRVYQDCHCWVFTYQTFLSVLGELDALDVAPMVILRHEAPVYGSNEFHVVLAPKVS